MNDRETEAGLQMDNLVTVFGGSGFLGRYVVRALARQGYRIRVGVRRPQLANYLLPMGRVGQIQLLRANVLSPDAVAFALKGASACVNLVGVLQESGRQSFNALHAEAAGMIAAAAKNSGATSVVHVSAIGADIHSAALYAHTKAEGEDRVREGFPGAVILRPSIVFGVEDNFFNRFAALARVLPFLPLIGGGNTRFQPVYVGDIAKAVERCLKDGDARGRVYELGGPGIFSFRELMQIVLRETYRRRRLIPLPFPVAELLGRILQVLPNAPLTADQVRLLKADTVVSDGALTFADLGIEPEPLEAILPTYLWRFRREGQYEQETRERLLA
jgi:NADH dehydrogenase